MGRALTPNKKHDMYLLHSSLRSTFGTQCIDSEEKCKNKINKILLAKTSQPWWGVSSHLATTFQLLLWGPLYGFLLGEEYNNWDVVKQCPERSETALSNTSARGLFKSFKREKMTLSYFSNNWLFESLYFLNTVNPDMWQVETQKCDKNASE